ncbi:MAG: hypothetical protein DI551_00850 [Micavibrio aeruginosavorus]|uniref:O-antigen ligase-related domain-containing protein n=1 Tax=Micavibrio aeruginosavorus TaxID=349221 RepID=A0A2W5QBW5_9BACT|nr:MAG: hypothetical protein DI551_00850 [Micavibrio aeruginosavorus]
MQIVRQFNFVAFAPALCFVMAAALQIQITLFKSDAYLGLRVNLADIVAVLVAPIILLSLLLKNSQRPQWSVRRLYIWLAALTGILLLSLFHNYLNYGEVSRWALTNKVGGWLILMALMGAGAWIAANADRSFLQNFLTAFFFFFLIVSSVDIVVSVLRFYLNPHEFKYLKPLDGLMANRNAFSMLFLCGFSIAMTARLRKMKFIPSYFCYFLLFTAPLLLAMNGSRAGYIATCILFAVMAISQRDNLKEVLKIALLLLLGHIFSYGVLHSHQNKLKYLSGNTFELLEKSQISTEEAKENIRYRGDKIRITILEDARDMVKKHPILGNGLGSTMIYQREKHGKTIDLIDCTPLWLWVETGLIGLAAFSAFYFCAVRALLKRYKEEQDEIFKHFYLLCLYTILGFSIMCLLHEIMYTRFLWFFLGMALALPKRHQSV